MTDPLYVIVHRTHSYRPPRDVLHDVHTGSSLDDIRGRVAQLQRDAVSYGRVRDTYRVAELRFVDEADMFQQAYLGVQKVLDGAIGGGADDGEGAGVVADVALLAQRYADLKDRTIAGGWPAVVAEVEAAGLRGEPA